MVHHVEIDDLEIDHVEIDHVEIDDLEIEEPFSSATIPYLKFPLSPRNWGCRNWGQYFVTFWWYWKKSPPFSLFVFDGKFEMTPKRTTEFS